LDTPSHKTLFLAVQSLLSQIDAVASSYDIYLPVESHATASRLLIELDTSSGATHVYQALSRVFGVIKPNVPDIVEFIGALDRLYLPVGVELTIVVPLGIPDPEIIVPLVIVSVLVRMVPETDPVIVLMG
jgi:hypothetical protein